MCDVCQPAADSDSNNTTPYFTESVKLHVITNI